MTRKNYSDRCCLCHNLMHRNSDLHINALWVLMRLHLLWASHVRVIGPTASGPVKLRFSSSNVMPSSRYRFPWGSAHGCYTASLCICSYLWHLRSRALYPSFSNSNVLSNHLGILVNYKPLWMLHKPNRCIIFCCTESKVFAFPYL